MITKPEILNYLPIQEDLKLVRATWEEVTYSCYPSVLQLHRLQWLMEVFLLELLTVDPIEDGAISEELKLYSFKV